jgi:hypothetical protein
MCSLQKLNDYRERKIQNLSRWNSHAHKTYQFIQENPDLFEKPVLGPIVLEVSLKNERYADAVEAVMQRLLLTFVAQTEKDYHTLMSNVNDRMRFSINAVQYSHLKRDRYQPKHTEAQLKQMGFDGVLSDFFEAPDPIMVAILENTFAHLIVRGLLYIYFNIIMKQTVARGFGSSRS